MHFYKEQPGDIISKQLHPDGALYLYTVLREGIHANGWSRKKYYPNAVLQEEENFSNGLLIEKINFSESGAVISHKIWNIRLKQLVSKPAAIQLPKPNVVSGCARIYDYFKCMPSISEFIHADYSEDSLMQFFITSGASGEKETTWTLTGKQMSFSIYWENGEVAYHWYCHCFTEELYWKARDFLKQHLK